jgi:hypothetical protein
MELYEKMIYDANGAMVNAALRDYRIPAFADVPRSEIYLADTYDKVGPLGAKAQGECGINPVAPAIANAVANAMGIRFPDLLSPGPHFRQTPLQAMPIAGGAVRSVQQGLRSLSALATPSTAEPVACSG